MRDLFKVLLRPMLYIISFFIPKSFKYVVVGGWNGKRYADNSRAMYEYLDKNKSELGIKKVFWYTKSTEIYNMLKKQGKDVLIGKNLSSIYWHFRSKVHIIDWMYCDIIGELSVRTIRIDLWHGMPLKKFGYMEKGASINKWERFVKEGCWRKKYLLTTSELSRELLSWARGVEKEKCLIASYPRNERLYVKQNYIKGDNDLFRVFYLPTFRNNDSINPILEADLKLINNKMKEQNIVIYIKPHFASYAEWNSKANFSNIKILDAKEDVYEWLHNMDLLITDYSSVYFDYMLTRRPILFYIYDYKYYLNDDRGFALPYDEYTPGKKIYETQELFETIIDIMNNYDKYIDKYIKQYEMINQEVNLYTDRPNYEQLLKFWNK